jgi:putative nucleotidyltransferase with HDIG domain
MLPALTARDLPSAVTPTLEHLVAHTAADGAAFFQVDAGALAYHARAASGEMPSGPVMAAIAAHGLPAETPLMRALRGANAPLFFDDTSVAPDAAGFPDLGVASLAAAPVRRADGRLLGAFLMHTFAAHAWSPDEAAAFSLVAGMVASLAGRLAAEEEAALARESALRALGLALEERDQETKGHTDRVTAMALELGCAAGLDDEALTSLRWGAYLHDVGKIAVSDAVLLKPGRLDDGERRAMQGHATAGARFAGALGFVPVSALDVVASHHERWDGGGYPAGLAGEDIPLPARIFAVVDVYDALVSERPYKAAWPRERAVAEIVAQAGRHFDPRVVELFVALEPRLAREG